MASASSEIYNNREMEDACEYLPGCLRDLWEGKTEGLVFIRTPQADASLKNPTLLKLLLPLSFHLCLICILDALPLVAQKQVFVVLRADSNRPPLCALFVVLISPVGRVFQGNNGVNTPVNKHYLTAVSVRLIFHHYESASETCLCRSTWVRGTLGEVCAMLLSLLLFLPRRCDVVRETCTLESARSVCDFSRNGGGGGDGGVRGGHFRMLT